MAKSQTQTKTADTEPHNAEGWSDPLPPPITVEGFMRLEEGTKIEGVLLERQVGEKYGPYYAIRVNHPVRVSRGGEYLDLPKGSIVGLSEVAALRPLADVMRKGAMAVRILALGRAADGKTWDLEVRTRPAF